jgi:hypothetical protein
MSTGGEVANALVCKTSIRGFDPHPVLHKLLSRKAARQAAFLCFKSEPSDRLIECPKSRQDTHPRDSTGYPQHER